MMANNWTCSNCGCVHWDELAPISCIMCNNDIFHDSPDKFYQKDLETQTNYVKDKENEDS